MDTYLNLISVIRDKEFPKGSMIGVVGITFSNQIACQVSQQHCYVHKYNHK
jgi:hypothetical protein